jgi:hypothetical protein
VLLLWKHLTEAFETFIKAPKLQGQGMQAIELTKVLAPASLHVVEAA